MYLARNRILSKKKRFFDEFYFSFFIISSMLRITFAHLFVGTYLIKNIAI